MRHVSMRHDKIRYAKNKLEMWCWTYDPDTRMVMLQCYICTGCGHCKNAKPHFELAAMNMKNDGNIILCAVDCTVHTGLLKLLSVLFILVLLVFGDLANH